MSYFTFLSKCSISILFLLSVPLVTIMTRAYQGNELDEQDGFLVLKFTVLWKIAYV